MISFTANLLYILVFQVCLVSSLPDDPRPGNIADNNYAACLNDEEMALFDALNDYRAHQGLHAIVLSRSLTHVAQLHCIDLALYEPHKQKSCNLHSWSTSSSWSACCYTADHKKAACMWNKPRELTMYQGDGYEIAFFSSFPYNGPAEFAADAIQSWSKSSGHNDVMTNRMRWKTMRWQAVGVGFYQGYATIWFGTSPDPDLREVVRCS